MSANSIHDSQGTQSVKTGKERRAENARKKQVARDKKQRASKGSVSPTGRVKDDSRDFDEGRSGKRSGGGRRRGGGGGRPRVSNSGAGNGGIGQIFTCISAICVLIVGFMHLFWRIDSLDVCNDDNDNVECYMSSLLFWENGNIDEISPSLNQHWRYSGFTFIPSIFVDLWTPMIFGVISCLQMISGTEWYLISGNWVKAMLWHTVMALFACFGYAGQAGLIIGTIVSFTAILCFFGAVAKWGGRPYLTIG